MGNKKQIIEGEEINLIALLAYFIDLIKKYSIILILLPLLVGGIGIAYFKVIKGDISESRTYEATLMGRSMLLTPNEVENFIKSYQIGKNSPAIEIVKIRDLGLNGYYTTEVIIKFTSTNDDIVPFKNNLVKSIVENQFVKAKLAEKIAKEQAVLNSIEEEIAKSNSKTQSEKDCILNMLVTKAEMEMRIKQQADFEVVNDFQKVEPSTLVSVEVSKKKYILAIVAGFALAIALIILLEIKKKLSEFRKS